MAKGFSRRVCAACGQRFCVAEPGLVTVESEGLAAGKVRFWLCIPCGKRIEKAIAKLGKAT